MRRSFSPSRSIRGRLILGLVVLQVAATLVVGIMWYSSESRATLARVDHELTHLANTLGMMLDAAELQQLAQEGASSHLYQKYLQIGSDFARNSDMTNVWASLGTSSEQLTTAFIYPELERPGDTFRIPEGTFREAVATALGGGSAATGIYQDSLGAWKSGIRPLVDRQGRVIGAVGVDIDASFVLAKLRQVRWQIVGLLILAILGATVLGIIFANSFSQHITAATTFVRSIASGDLSVDELEVSSQDEVGQMVNGLNVMLRGLHSLLENVSSSANSVAEASEELNSAAEQSAQATGGAAQAVQQLANGASEQAGASEEISTTMEQLQQTIQQIASGAQESAHDVQKAPQWSE